jgi:uncharacterized protein YjiS (DUF1127 family)
MAMTGTTISTMGATLPARPTLFRRACGRAAALLAGISAGLSRQALNVRVLRQLGAMSERELKDIGLARQDVWDAAALPHDGDATTLLLARRAERKAARRG